MCQYIMILYDYNVCLGCFCVKSNCLYWAESRGEVDFFHSVVIVCKYVFVILCRITKYIIRITICTKLMFSI